MVPERDYRSEMKGSPGWPVHWACERFELTLGVLRENLKELLTFVGEPLIKPLFAFPDHEGRMLKKRSDSEVIRRLHNFVAAAMTLVDHSRTFSKVHLNQENSLRYKDLRSIMKSDPEVQFVQLLRNYLLHAAVPQICDHVNWRESINKIGLIPSSLLAWGRWTNPVRKLLKQLSEGKEYFYISDFAASYGNKAENISYQLLNMIISQYRDDLEYLYNVHREFLRVHTSKGYVFDPLITKYFTLANGELVIYPLFDKDRPSTPDRRHRPAD
ncbi:MAG: hypothetical protein A2Y81_10625 [Nitrospirae bacterium RBG_13_43_8]|nr:MAG: hypothetical protein A2Y81_10625 [Nitrospirae bacterium RBG_13_43_8]